MEILKSMGIAIILVIAITITIFLIGYFPYIILPIFVIAALTFLVHMIRALIEAYS